MSQGDAPFRLILIRHGNTFAPGEKVVMVGREQDVPLVPTGFEQARACARALSQAGVSADAVFCGPLLRTRQTAGELLAVWGRPAAAAEIDGRLAELDYGRWSGLSDAEIVGRFGEAALRGWRDLGKWPEGAGWGEGEPAVAERVKRFARDAQARLGPGRTAVAVSSNGLLRYFLTLVPGLFEARAAAKQLAVRTGHMGELRARTGIFELACWNVGPDEFFSLSGGPADR